MQFIGWLKTQLARVPLAAPAIASIAAILFTDQLNGWFTFLFFISVLLGALSRRGVWVLCIIFGGLAGWLHHDQLARQAEVAEAGGNRWCGEVELLQPVRYGKAFVQVVDGDKERLQAWFDSDKQAWEIGQRLYLEGRLVTPEEPLNPEVFDKKGWLWRQSVGAVLVVREVSLSEVQDGRFWLRRAALQTREFLAKRLALGFDPECDAVKIVHAMTLGVRPSESAEMLKAYRYSGAIHVFAVSGLHVMMVGSMVAILLRLLGCGRRVWIPLVIVAMFFYALVTGMRPPAMRASIMGAILLSTWLVQRKIVLSNSVAAGCIIALLWDGHLLFQPGFQLSFGVLLAISLLGGIVTKGFHWVSYIDPFLPRSLYSRWQEWSVRARRKLQGALVVASCAWCGASPMTLMHFKLLAPISILVSVPLVLCLYLILISSGISVLLGSVWSPLGVTVNQWNGMLANGSYSLVRSAAGVTGGHIVAQPWSEGERVVVYALPDGASAVYVGVGGGVLIDTGGSREFAREVLPSLEKNGARLDSLILSHADSKHCGGVERLLTQFHIKQAVVSEESAMSRSFMAARKQLADVGCVLSNASRGEKFELSEQCFIEVIYAPQGRAPLADDRCLLLRLHWRGLRWLFVNDAGFQLEQWVLENEVDVSADILVLGRHERDLQVGLDFGQAVGAQLIVGNWESSDISAGEQYLLGSSGALTVEWKKRGFEFQSQRLGAFTLE